MRVTANGEGVRYSSARTHKGAPDASFDASYRPTGPIEPAAPGSLAHWLTERYCLYAAGGSRIWRGEIHHTPWPLQPADAKISLNTMSQAAGIDLPTAPPLLHFARLLDVRLWAPAEVTLSR
jgi:uncharacterized protein YqjF (DUF2071 family)